MNTLKTEWWDDLSAFGKWAIGIPRIMLLLIGLLGIIAFFPVMFVVVYGEEKVLIPAWGRTLKWRQKFKGLFFS